MACMCGDIQCWSCGPAQGNWRCPICRAWADDGCEHIADDGQNLKPEFHAEAERIAAEERAADDELARQLEEADAMYDEVARADYRREAYGAPCPRHRTLTWGGDCPDCEAEQDALKGGA